MLAHWASDVAVGLVRGVRDFHHGRLVFVGCALITGGERFRDAGSTGGFHEEEIAHPGGRERHDLILVFENKAKTLAFIDPAQLSYQGFAPSRLDLYTRPIGSCTLADVPR
jgi:hypothetical protein